jgi:hypothetical protein
MDTTVHTGPAVEAVILPQSQDNVRATVDGRRQVFTVLSAHGTRVVAAHIRNGRIRAVYLDLAQIEQVIAPCVTR